MFNVKTAKGISEFFYSLDILCRKDLSFSMIASENDYVSRLITHIRFPFGPFKKGFGRFFTRVLRKGEEKLLGCDSIVVFKYQNQLKVGLFEAKWPRRTLKRYHPWDDFQKGKTAPGVSRKSHFSSQIHRQFVWSKSAAVWEMFLYESPLYTYKTPYDKLGSSCVWNSVAYNFLSAYPALETRRWGRKDLDKLLESRPRSPKCRRYGNNLRDIIYKIIKCDVGQKIDIENNQNSFMLSGYNDMTINIPIPCKNSQIDGTNNKFNDENNECILTFMEGNGICNYIFIDIEEFLEFYPEYME